MNLEEKMLEKNYIYNGRIINLRNDLAQLPNGKTAYREVVEHPGGVCVIALTKENEVIFVKQYRYPYGKIILEIPAGKREKGEDPLLCGKRELLEETGYSGKSYISLGQMYPTPGYTDEIIHIYAVENAEFSAASPDDDEFVQTVKIPFEQAVQMVLNNEIEDGKTQIAILKLRQIKNG